MKLKENPSFRGPELHAFTTVSLKSWQYVKRECATSQFSPYCAEAQPPKCVKSPFVIRKAVIYWVLTMC